MTRLRASVHQALQAAGTVAKAFEPQLNASRTQGWEVQQGLGVAVAQLGFVDGQGQTRPGHPKPHQARGPVGHRLAPMAQLRSRQAH